MTIEKLRNYIHTYSNANCKAFKLLEKVASEFESRGVEPDTIEYASEASEDAPKIGTRQLHIETVQRHNGTAEDVSVNIEITEVTKVNSATWYSSKTIAKIKVPKEASDKVIKNRVDKAIEYLNK